MGQAQPEWWFAVTFTISVIALFFSWQKHRGTGPRSALKIEFRNASDSKGTFWSRGWIENPLVPLTDEDAEDQQVMAVRSRIPAYFAKALITNNGPFTAGSITLSLTRIKFLTDQTKDSIDTVQPLRWSDTWFFQADGERKTVNASSGITTFPSLPLKSYRYCDVCFHYDLDGPKRLGRFKKGQVYFAVGNLPSNTYAVGDGEYLVTFHLVGENCDPVERTYKLFVNMGIKKPSERVRFEQTD